ncbi:RDD family protein [Terasakiella sp. A23]|uniref:RDD family protein n=1 Tax=Terasakiella sp. FCG-A23 TaxID=3080561 RepID=UPI002953F14D|nr:RDD family protein [Terasakiella sp. A23]MDV7338674.1 RDD family protein [Terasakiella sp. A23]
MSGRSSKVPAPQWQRFEEHKKAEGPDPVEYPDYYDGISVKRIIAYAIDFLICAVVGFIGAIFASVVGLMSFGLLFGPLMALLALIPITYHTLLIGSSRAATLGMRFVGIRVYRLDGERPEMLQAFIQTAIFFFTAPPTSFLILIVCLFNTRQRCLHDILAGTIVLNDLEQK